MSDGSDPLADAPVEWPPDTPRYRLTLPADGDPLDLLAAVLDATSRPPASATVLVTVGRRDDRELVRSALSDLAIHPDVTVGDRATSGTVPVTGDTFEVLADLAEEIHSLLVRDDDGTAILERREEQFTVALSDDGIETLQSSLSGPLADRLEQL